MSAVARCCACTILIGPGYATPVGIPTPDRRGVLCGGCLAALRSAARRGKDAWAVLGEWRRQAQQEVRSREDRARWERRAG